MPLIACHQRRLKSETAFARLGHRLILASSSGVNDGGAMEAGCSCRKMGGGGGGGGKSEMKEIRGGRRSKGGALEASGSRRDYQRWQYQTGIFSINGERA